MSAVEFILYVRDQQRSRDFYSLVLKQEPVLHVPGMTEFQLNEMCKLGLMPENGIARIIRPALPHPAERNGIPACEIYLFAADVNAAYQNALAAGAIPVSPPEARNWGDEVAYCADPDGHVIAFAKRLS